MTPRHLGRISVLALWGDGQPVYGGAYTRGYPASILQRFVALTPGQPLSYDVWIGGPASIAQAGPSCFGYRERLLDDKNDRVVPEETHELDCRALVNLPRRGRVLAMRLRVPTTVTTGDPLELDWQADTDLGGGSWAEVTTTAATSEPVHALRSRCAALAFSTLAAMSPNHLMCSGAAFLKKT